MTKRTDFTLQGVAELKKALAELGPHMATKVGQAANNRAGKVLAEKIKAAAPVGDPDTSRTYGRKDGSVVEVDYGHLRDNIKARRVKSRTAHTVVTVVTAGKAFWAKFLEFGTRKMPAKPFWRPAQDAAANDIVNAQLAELRKGLERAVKRLAKGLKP